MDSVTNPDVPEDSADSAGHGSTPPAKPPVGQRGRFIEARPPALAPQAREEADAPETTDDYSSLSVAPSQHGQEPEDTTPEAPAAPAVDFRRPASEIHLANERHAYDHYEFGLAGELGHSADPGADPAGRQYRASSQPTRARALAGAGVGASSTAGAGTRTATNTTAGTNAPEHTATPAATATTGGGDVPPEEETPTDRTAAAAAEQDKQNEQPSDADVVRTGGSMAIATLLSRITGFLRTVLIGSALGAAVASAFNTANTLPNLITELVLGAVLTSLVVPVLVRAEKEDPDRGEAFIRRLLTMTFSITVIITLLAVLGAPWLIRLTLDQDGQVNVQMATMFAYLVLPQIFFYAMFAVFMAVLNTKGVFKPGAWAPVVNNLVTITVLGGYLLLPEDTKLQPTDHVTISDPHVLLLGLGTTLGVVFQALIMVPYLRKAGINLRPLWGVDERLKNFAGMGVAIVLYVAISQAGWAINNQIASSASGDAPTIYMNAWQLLQMPYGVIGVTLLTAVMPRLSRNAADGDDKAVVRDLTVATRLTMFAMIPIIVFMTAFGGIIGPALFAYRSFSMETASVLGWTVSFSAFTLIPYSLVLLHLRVFYAREEVWTPTFIIAGITITKIALVSIAPFIATEPRLVVVLLGAANGFGFVTGAIIGVLLLRRSLGNLNSGEVMRTSLWAFGASLVGALVAWLVDLALTNTIITPGQNPGFLIRLLITGPVFLIATGVVMARSKLPEVLTVGSALSRVPGIGRFFSGRQAEEELGSAAERMVPTPLGPAEAAREAAVANSLLPPLPPLSAGRVRGPRLVPGAPILDGRYRLLADHGGSTAARFWQARRTATGELVGLTILDPLAAVRQGKRPGEYVPNQSRLVMQVKQDMSRKSRAMMEAQEATLARASEGAEGSEGQAAHPLAGLAQIHQVIDSPGSVVVVSDWTDGSALSAVAESSPDPLAVGFAVADLAEAAAEMHDHGLALGVDHRDRIRISTAGGAVLAFPGFLPNNSSAQDMQGIASVLELLLANVPVSEIPKELLAESLAASNLDAEQRAAVISGGAANPVTGHAEATDANEDDEDRDADHDRDEGDVPPNPADRDPRELATRLRYLTSGELAVNPDEAPTPQVQKTGFGVRQARLQHVAIIGGIAIGSALLIAALVASLLSVVGGGREDSPLSTDSIRSGAEGIINREPTIVPIRNVREWMPTGAKGTLDAPEDVQLVTDGRAATKWQSDSYLSPLGRTPEATKEGIGLLVDLPTGTRIHALQLEGLAPGMKVELRRVDEATAPTDPAAPSGAAIPNEAGAKASAQPSASEEPTASETAPEGEATATATSGNQSANLRKVPLSLDETTSLGTVTATESTMNVEFHGEDGQDVLVGRGANQKLLKAMASAKAKEAAKAGGADEASEGAESEEERAEDAEKKEQGTKPMKQLLIWITQLPEADGRATLGELRVMGTWQGQNRVDETSTAPISPTPSSSARGSARAYPQERS
ncbi:murein biosynthesis integral membrane protein MurJ [Corynebacterium urealyticum]|uniref:murein biosynthesis integral membrane protein MurJ n=1 Tax=Corynebacterium urealyticum TaxID=43771 RepID=UPI00293E72D6|nr:murein biosynthesis integral membrane protein MurJ [Corynebacterium urealyticum]WOH94418.1 murein biosynthesis integral membrane protein MurJ [Corynebacterium urealyticum]